MKHTLTPATVPLTGLKEKRSMKNGHFWRTRTASPALETLSRRGFIRVVGGTVIAASVGGLALLPARRADAGTVQRPLSDFLSAQGTFCLPDGMGGCFSFFPPVPSYIAFGNDTGSMFALVDYAGVANTWANGAFGTQIGGTVTERALSDGRAQVDVNLQASHALTFVVTPTPSLTLLFGHLAPDVLAGADGAFGDSHFRISFINTAPGAPLPDLEQLLNAPAPGQEWVLYEVQATAKGTLRSAFGVPDGTPGMLTVAQTGNLPKRSNIQASVINLRPVGG